MTAITNTTRNGIDVAQVYGTLDAIAADPSLARFEFRVSNRWIVERLWVPSIQRLRTRNSKRARLGSAAIASSVP